MSKDSKTKTTPQVSATSTTKGKKGKEPLPNIQNATPEFLADELGKTREQKNILERQEKWYREGLLAKLGKQITCAGEEFRATVSETSQIRWNTEALEHDFGADEEFIAKYKKPIEFKTVSTKRIDPADTQAKED